MNIGEILEKAVAQNQQKPFVYFENEVLDYHMFNSKVNKAANFLRELGIKKGDRVCLFLPNCLEFLYIWFGLAKIGGIMVPINKHLRGDGLRYVIQDSNPQCIIINEDLFESYEYINKELKIKNHIWNGESSPPINFHSVHELMESASNEISSTVDVTDEDPQTIFYTSGSTGLPKGVVLSHRSYIQQGINWVKEIICVRPDDVFFTSLPLYYANAQLFTTMGAIASGRPFVLSNHFSASRFIDEVRRYNVTVFNYVGWMLPMINKQRPTEDDAKNPVRIMFGGAAPVLIWKSFEKRFNVKIIECYGLAETGGICLCNTSSRIGSVGKPVGPYEIKIWDETNNEMPMGEVGEIVLREKKPFSIFLGYYNQPERTSAAWDDGWFHTGDLGYIDEDAYVFYVDNMKGYIRRHGWNISPTYIEKTINSHPSILCSMAVKVSSEFSEDEIKIMLITRTNEKISPEEVLAYCKKNLASYMVPRYVEIIENSPEADYFNIFKSRKRGILNAWDREKAQS